MPSSTSNSDAKLPADSSRSLLVGVLLAAAVLAVWEAGWRTSGLVASPGHGDEFWAVRRVDLPPEAIALVGTSRFQTDIDPDILTEELGREVVQLAILGASPLPVLENLAADPEFRGAVLVDLVPRVAFDATGAHEPGAEAQLAGIGLARRPSTRTEVTLKARLRSWLTTQRPELSLTAMMKRVGRGGWPPLTYVSTETNGFRRLDFQRADGPEREAALLRQLTKVGRPSTPEERRAIVLRITEAVESIRERGGEVIFVRMPAGGRLGAYEVATYPRDRYWDPSVAELAAPAIHYADVPDLGDFECPDGSHIDYRDSARFTRAFAAAVSPHLPPAAAAP